MPDFETAPAKQSFNGIPLTETEVHKAKMSSGQIPTGEPAAYAAPNWVQIGRTKALCGMVNSLLEKGNSPGLVLAEMANLRQLLRHIEAEAKRE